MTLSPVESAWREAIDQQHKRYALIETGLIQEEARLRLLQSARLKTPVMYQDEFVELQTLGPWLLDVSDLAFTELSALVPGDRGAALMGWISSDCLLDRLRKHLGDALLAQDDSGAVYLLRSYLPTTLPLLHARTDAPWHAWLFGPLHQWWLPAADGSWHGLAGQGLEEPGDYRPIQLDAQLWQALELDPLVFSLTGELEKHDGHVFTSPCHGDRLKQVERAIEAARREGLQQQQDVSLYATLQLFDRQFPANWPQWPQALLLVQEHGMPLAQAIRTSSK